MLYHWPAVYIDLCIQIGCEKVWPTICIYVRVCVRVCVCCQYRCWTWYVSPCVAVCCSVLQCVALCCSVCCCWLKELIHSSVCGCAKVWRTVCICIPTYLCVCACALGVSVGHCLFLFVLLWVGGTHA